MHLLRFYFLRQSLSIPCLGLYPPSLVRKFGGKGDPREVIPCVSQRPGGSLLDSLIECG